MTQPNAERKAVLNLERQGFSCYVPKFNEVLVRQGRKISRSGVLFSRYVFVFIHDRWNSIRSTIGVSLLLTKEDGKPAIVDEAFIVSLISNADNNGFIKLDKPERKIGDKVTINSGPFKDHIGVFKGMTTREREIVLLNVMGRSVHAVVPSYSVATS